MSTRSEATGIYTPGRWTIRQRGETVASGAGEGILRAALRYARGVTTEGLDGDGRVVLRVDADGSFTWL